MSAVYPFGARLADWLLPNHCCLCGCMARAVVCEACHRQFVMPRAMRCRRCANPLAASGAEAAGAAGTAGAAPGKEVVLCGRCLSDPPAFDAALAAVDYASPLDQLVLQLKFASNLALASWCAMAIRDVVLEQQKAALPDLLCPVPLGPQRLVERGFNQSLEIARPLAAMLGIELWPTLAMRVVETLPQSSLVPGERAGNVKRAFTLAPGNGARDCPADAIQDRHVGIVDDVMTSGQTAQAMAAMLKRFGAARVSIFVFARTPPK